MKILFIGYSNLLRARILPIIDRTAFQEVAIAKFSEQHWEGVVLQNEQIVRYDSFEEGLQQFDGNLVYISIVNSQHYKYAKMSLEAGFNTIVDKPATSTLAETEDLLSIAKKNNLLLSESTVYLFHPQIKQIQDIFLRNDDIPKLITTHFTMPPFALENFRYRKELGGGAIMDTSPYAVSVGRRFFDSDPIQAFTIVNEQLEDGLEIEYSLLMKYPDGKSLIGHFGFNTEYTNKVVIMGNRTNVAVNRIYTIPENLSNTLEIDSFNKHTIEYTELGNTFENYLNYISNCLLNNFYDECYNTILSDAKARELININIK